MSDLDDYANSMFRFERLNDGWIDRCTEYLKHIFGNAIVGKTVIDYAFGRGNWSVAFIRAGASRVVAIDASSSNVSRFKAYCQEQALQNIDVICGNVVEAPLDVRGDILWLYGILPAISDQEPFIRSVLSLVPAREALVLAYGYDAHSLREFIVESVRREVCYSIEAEFRAESLKYTPAGRMRARDDLTAPHVHWHTAASLADHFRPFEFEPVKQFDDFRIWLHGYSDAEFSPHHILLKRGNGPGVPLAEPRHPFARDVELLKSLWAELFPRLSNSERKDFAITVFNTYFSHLSSAGEPEACIIQIYLLLLYGFRSKVVGLEAVRNPAASYLLRLGDEAIGNADRSRSADLDDAYLVRYLQANTVRI